jgi:hypothetical protein
LIEAKRLANLAAELEAARAGRDRSQAERQPAARDAEPLRSRRVLRLSQIDGLDLLNPSVFSGKMAPRYPSIEI